MLSKCSLSPEELCFFTARGQHSVGNEPSHDEHKQVYAVSVSFDMASSADLVLGLAGEWSAAHADCSLLCAGSLLQLYPLPALLQPAPAWLLVSLPSHCLFPAALPAFHCHPATEHCVPPYNIWGRGQQKLQMNSKMRIF